MRKLIQFFRKINRLWLLVALAVVLGLAAAYLVSSYLKGREQILQVEAKKRASGGPTVEVVAAGMDVNRGVTLGTQNLTKREILADLVTEEMVLVSDFERVDGVKTTRPIQAGWPLRLADITEKTVGIAEGLVEGLRAITIEVDEINSMAQMVKPGNMVDLMLIVPDANDANGGHRVVLVLQSVKVLATGQSVVSMNSGKASQQPNRQDAQGPGGGPERYSNFTFEVTPKNAARIALAQQIGKIRAVLRGNEDNTTVTLENINTRSMLNNGNAGFNGLGDANDSGDFNRAGGSKGSRRAVGPSGPSASSGSNGSGEFGNGSGANGVASSGGRNGKAVEYIIGGKGSSSAVNINIPSLFPPLVGERRIPNGAGGGAGGGAEASPYPPGFPSFPGYPAQAPGTTSIQQRP